MPYGDRTGPNGMGPMTGRGMGFCTGNDRPGCYEPGPGMGRGRSFGRGGGGRGLGGGGRGWRNMFHATGLPGWARFGGYGPGAAPAAPDPEAEKQALRGQADALRGQLDQIQSRLDALEGGEQ